MLVLGIRSQTSSWLWLLLVLLSLRQFLERLALFNSESRKRQQQMIAEVTQQVSDHSYWMCCIDAKLSLLGHERPHWRTGSYFLSLLSSSISWLITGWKLCCGSCNAWMANPLVGHTSKAYWYCSVLAKLVYKQSCTRYDTWIFVLSQVKTILTQQMAAQHRLARPKKDEDEGEG